MRIERAALGPPMRVAADGDALADTVRLRRRARAAPVLGAVATDAFALTTSEEDAMDVKHVTERLTAQRQTLLDAIASLPDGALDRKGMVGDWSIKNTLAHLVAWEEVLIRITPERARTGAYPEALRAINAEEDGYNAQTVAGQEQLTPQDQLAKAARVRAELLVMIRGLGDDALARTHPWPEWQDSLGAYFLASVGEHEEEHAAAIRVAAEQLRAG
jgi:uncharacterized damage-inducible protein DinB